MKVLRNHLQEIRSQIVSVSIPGDGGNPSTLCPAHPVTPAGLFVLPSWFDLGSRGPSTRWLLGHVFILLLWNEEGRAEKRGDGHEMKGLWAK